MRMEGDEPCTATPRPGNTCYGYLGYIVQFGSRFWQNGQRQSAGFDALDRNRALPDQADRFTWEGTAGDGHHVVQDTRKTADGGRGLHPKAWAVVLLMGLYAAARSLTAIFVSVYLWVNSLDFNVVCHHYLALYLVTPFVFIAAGWYSQARERLHMYRLGLVLHVVYYAVLLSLRERSPEYAGLLGALLGVTWGVFYAGSNTFNFDVTEAGKREYFFGLLQTVRGSFRFLAPLLGGAIIRFSHVPAQGYHRLFAAAIFLFAFCFALSYQVPPDSTPRPFRLRRALFPGKDQRDWRLVMWSTIAQGGRADIFAFLLGILIYMQTADELSVGGYASFRALVGIAAAYVFGRVIGPRNRRRPMFWGTVLLVAGGALLAIRLNLYTLVAFGFLQALAGPMFGIPHAGLRLDIIADSVEEPAQRIEYISAREVPLAVGRIFMMVLLIALYSWLSRNATGLRVALFVMCALRIVTYIMLARTSAMSAPAGGSA